MTYKRNCVGKHLPDCTHAVQTIPQAFRKLKITGASKNSLLILKKKNSLGIEQVSRLPSLRMWEQCVLRMLPSEPEIRQNLILLDKSSSSDNLLSILILTGEF